MFGNLRRFSRDQRAVATVEFAIIAPAMFVMFTGTFEATDYVRAYTRAGFAAQSLANLIAAQSPSGGTLPASGTGAMADLCLAANAVIEPYSSASSTLTVGAASYTTSASNPPSSSYTCGTGAAFAPTIAVPSGLWNTTGDCVIEVQVKYTYASPTQFLPYFKSITITEAAFARPRNNSALTL